MKITNGKKISLFLRSHGILGIIIQSISKSYFKEKHLNYLKSISTKRLNEMRNENKIFFFLKTIDIYFDIKVFFTFCIFLKGFAFLFLNNCSIYSKERT